MLPITETARHCVQGAEEAAIQGKPSVLEVEGLQVGMKGRGGGGKLLVEEVSFHIRQGEMLGLVGESGSGKSLSAAAIGGLLPRSLYAQGTLRFHNERNLLELDQAARRRLRGKEIGWVFQDFQGSFTPFRKLGDQLIEVLRTHEAISLKDAKEGTLRWLERVGLPPERAYASYPFQLSGGQRQRAAIAAALMPGPSLLIADEPTSALDVVTGERIMDLLSSLQAEKGCSILFITHDLRHVWRRADQLAVMKTGKLVETGKPATIRERPAHPFTKELLAAYPRMMSMEASAALSAPADGDERFPNRPNSFFEPLAKANGYPHICLEASGLTKHFKGDGGDVAGVDGVSFSIERGECVGLVGESGCGKSTLARLLLALEAPSQGELSFLGHSLVKSNRRTLRELRRHIQVVFQDSTAALNDRLPIWRSVIEPLDNFRDICPPFFQGERLTRREKAQRLLQMTGLSSQHMDRYPHELSGGQRQRACIARSISLCPKLLVCDEPTSSLDVTTQKQILQLLRDLQLRLNMSVLFISHDIAAVSMLCGRVLVMKEGRIVDEFAPNALRSGELHPYTQVLIAAAQW